MNKGPFKEDLERDVMVLSASLKRMDIAPLLMQRPEFAGGPDRLQAYINWISHPSRLRYRKKVAKCLEEQT